MAGTLRQFARTQVRPSPGTVRMPTSVAIAAAGVSIVVVEQFARSVLGVADLAVVLVQGRVTAVGAPHDIEADLSSAYLGHATQLAELP